MSLHRQKQPKDFPLQSELKSDFSTHSLEGSAWVILFSLSLSLKSKLQPHRLSKTSLLVSQGFVFAHSSAICTPLPTVLQEVSPPLCLKLRSSPLTLYPITLDCVLHSLTRIWNNHLLPSPYVYSKLLKNSAFLFTTISHHKEQGLAQSR